MRKIIKIEFPDWPEWLDIDFLASCLSSESHMKDIEVNIDIISGEKDEN